MGSFCFESRFCTQDKWMSYSHVTRERSVHCLFACLWIASLLFISRLSHTQERKKREENVTQHKTHCIKSPFPAVFYECFEATRHKWNVIIHTNLHFTFGRKSFRIGCLAQSSVSANKILEFTKIRVKKSLCF